MRVGDDATVTLPIADEVALGDFARRLMAVLPPAAFIALYGDLGAGKTTLVKCAAAVVGIDPTEVVSPTFGLIHHHTAGQGIDSGATTRIVHADMYRLSGIDDLAETGWDDAVVGASHVFVEWPERIADALPADRIDLAIAIDSPTARTLTLIGRGPRHAEAVAALANQ